MKIIYKDKNQIGNCIIESKVSKLDEVLVLALRTGELKQVLISDLQMVGVVNDTIELREYL